MGSRNVVIHAIAVMLVVHAASAQAPAIGTGTHVRVWVPDSISGLRVGRVIDVGRDSMRIVGAQGHTAAFALSDVDRLEVSRQRRPVWTMFTPVATVPSGFILGGMFGFLSSGVTGAEFDHAMAWGAGVGAAAGLAGSVFLWKTYKREVWTRVDVPGRATRSPTRLLITPFRRHVAIGAGLSF